MTQRAEYIEKMELKLDKLNKKMEELGITAKEEKAEVQQKYKDEMGKLREQSKVAVAKLEELKTASVDSWEGMVTDMEKMHDAYTHSFFSFFLTPGSSASATQDADAEKHSSKDSKKK
jgi:hypothetical protein